MNKTLADIPLFRRYRPITEISPPIGQRVRVFGDGQFEYATFDGTRWTFQWSWGENAREVALYFTPTHWTGMDYTCTTRTEAASK